jgi:aryl-alcohol dehydrogenase-like predicted oxidoreductase
MSETTTLRPGGEALLAGRPVARIGYGTMQLGELPVHAGAEPDEAVALLRHAVELGVNHFDTAQFYGSGFANEMLRRALAPFHDDIVLVSKVGAKTGPDGTRLVPAQKPHELREEVDANLAGLGVDRLGAVNLRRTGGGVGLQSVGDQVVDLHDQLAEMIALRDEGKIGGIGLSNVTLEQLQQALPAGIVTVQNSYSMLDRSDEPLLELAEREGITWAPFFPLGSAFPGFPKVTEAPEVQDAARAFGVTPAQIGLAWLLQHSPQTLLIPGTRNLAHLTENVDTGRIALDAATVATLDALAGEGR